MQRPILFPIGYTAQNSVTELHKDINVETVEALAAHTGFMR